MRKKPQMRSDFGNFLVNEIKKCGMKQREFYDELRIAKPYFYDIISGKTSPPPMEMLGKMLEVLENHPSVEPVCRNAFFNEAAKGRQEIPADINNLIMEHPEQWDRIRELLNKMLTKKNEQMNQSTHL